MSAPLLDQNDRNGGTWTKLKRHLEEKLARLRERNDADLPELKTARIRGHIQAIQQILLLGTDKPPIQSEDELFKD